MTLEEAKTLKPGDMIHSLLKTNLSDGLPMRVKVTSVRTWKRLPDQIEIHFKRGMYEYGVLDVRDLSEIAIGDGKPKENLNV